MVELTILDMFNEKFFSSGQLGFLYINFSGCNTCWCNSKLSQFLINDQVNLRLVIFVLQELSIIHFYGCLFHGNRSLLGDKYVIKIGC